MYQEIKDFMLAKQAEFVAGSGLVLVSGGSVDRYEHQDAYALTPQFSVLKITGADAEVFLQGQLSSDVAGLADNGAQLSTYSNAKGRMQASLLIWRADDGFEAVIRTDLLERFAKRLSMFVLRSKVRIVPLDEARVAFWHNSAVTGEYQLLHRGDGFVDIVLSGGLGIRCDYQGGKSLSLINGELKNSTWADLALINQGIPWVSAATFEAFVPQMANFDLLGGAISFKKGCYPGQEIVARTQYLGKVKRRLFRALVTGADVAAGDEVFASAEESQSIGKIVLACKVENGIEVLVVMQTAAWNADPYVMNSNGQKAGLIQLGLPYKGADE